MRIVIDLDGVICELKKDPSESYADLTPVKGAKEKIKQLREKGHYIVISTARNMKTYDSNLGRIMKNVGKITLDWLDDNGIEYDEIYFGKPNADIYIDDRAIRFETWLTINEKLIDKKAKPR